MIEDLEDFKERLKDILLDVEREGIEDLVDAMEAAGFFKAPASTQFHGAYTGALVEHSYNVLEYARSLALAWNGRKWYDENRDSIILCSILHDLGKCGQFGKPLYVDNVLASGKKSDSKPYKTNLDLMTLPHEIVSVIEATKYIDLTEEEQRAIAWHNGLYGCFKYDIQGKETPLYMIIHFADLWVSRVVETKDKPDTSKE